jgi:Pyruvate/2-oxoacid:ferredoxin oxidoreductase delta subunit
MRRQLKEGSARQPRALNIKKLPRERRKQKHPVPRDAGWARRFFLRLRDDSQYQRSVVQFSFVLLCLWIGVEFYLFLQGLSSGPQDSLAPRPPGVEGFLPISALISLKYWVQTGVINTVHPSGLFILLAFLAVSVVLKKAFCSWLCPIGTLSESLWMLGRKIFRKNLNLPRWLDYPLRSVKYLLLLFFLWSIWNMDISSLAAFINSPYNKVAEIKMYLFFARISTFAVGVIGVLMALSMVIKNFWCRFLCPYGALLGLAGLLSPLRITRTKETCIDCELCTKACPSNIRVHVAGRVWSDECTSCLACVAVCPVKETLEVRSTKRGRAIPGWVLATFVTGIFVAVTGLAMLSGHWQNSITRGEYQRRIREIDAPIYQHFNGRVPDYGHNN